MSQQQERYTSHTEEETEYAEETRRAVGNQALNEAAAGADTVLADIKDLIDDEMFDEIKDLTDEQALELVNNFKQKNGQ